MGNILVVNAEGPETRVGVIERGQLAEYFIERKHDRGIVGNIYRGRVSKVLPGMQAAFVELGPTVERAAFLYVADVLGADSERKLFDLDDADSDESPEGTGSRLARRRRASQRKIEDLLQRGQEILVQIVKDPIANKGARVTGYLSLPGRYGVLMPSVDHVGVSRRIASEAERKRLRDIVTATKPKGVGFIVRTAAEGAADDEVRDDVDFLCKLWAEIGARDKKMKGPGLVYADLDLVLRTVRDLMHEDTKEMVIDDEEQYQRLTKFMSAFLPRYAERVTHYAGRKPIFDHYGIEAAVRGALSRKVPLKSGGHLVIDQSEALTAIDVNTGSFVGSADLETTVTENNMEACREIARQLRLRNIGGIIVLDFVDMEKMSNREKVWKAFNEALAADRARCNVTKISELGLVEMTRKRTRESLNQLLTEVCPTCAGDAVVKSTITVAHEILREVRRVGSAVKSDSIEVECAPAVAEALRTSEREYVDELEKRFQRRFDIKVVETLRPDQYRVAGRDSEEESTSRQRRRRAATKKANTRPASKPEPEAAASSKPKRSRRGSRKAVESGTAESAASESGEGKKSSRSRSRKKSAATEPAGDGTDKPKRSRRRRSPKGSSEAEAS